MEGSVRLLLIYPFERDNPSIPLRYCRYILRRLNFTFRIVEVVRDWHFFYTNFHSMGIDYGKIDIRLISTLMGIDYLILKAAEFEPDQVLIISGPPVAKRALEFFKEHDIQRIIWFVDGHEDFGKIRPLLPFCNVLFTRNRSLIEECKDLSFKGIILKGDSINDQFKEVASYLAENR